MFKARKNKMDLKEFCKMIASILVKHDPFQEGDGEPAAQLSAEERENLKDKLFVFRVVVLNILLMLKAASKQIKKAPFEIGLIVSHGAKLALKDHGYAKEQIELFGLSVVQDLKYQTDDFSQRDLSDADGEMLRNIVCENFTRKLMEEKDPAIPADTVQSLEEYYLTLTNGEYKFVEDLVEERFAQFKMVK